MQIGIPRERKTGENRVAITPQGVAKLIDNGHTVQIASEAGTGSGITDTDYQDAGATIVDQETAWDSDMVMKVKEPLEDEYEYLDDQILFTYLHLAAFPDLTERLLETDVTAIAYETVQTDDGSLPLLKPMSQVAGRMAPLMASYFLTEHQGGSGTLPMGLPGVMPSKAVVIGGGTVGTNAAKVASDLGADVTIIEIDQERLNYLDDHLDVNTRFSTEDAIADEITDADIVVGAVLVPGDSAPTVVTDEHVQAMPEGSVIVDVAVDQGGCVATTEPTSHDDPVTETHGILNYAVTNMPGAYARTATYGLTNATLPYAVEIANKGWKQACQDNRALRNGLNVADQNVTYEAVARVFDKSYTAFKDVV